MNAQPTDTPSDPSAQRTEDRGQRTETLSEPTPVPPAEPPPEAPAGPEESGPSAAPPPAAKTVLEGKKTEREVALERDLTDRERRIAALEDENGQLKAIPKVAQSRPAPQKKAGWTFFDAD
jgi:hypothetical protein